jgi:hypothetical protein
VDEIPLLLPCLFVRCFCQFVVVIFHLCVYFIAVYQVTTISSQCHQRHVSEWHFIQGYQKVSVHLMITVQKVTFKVSLASLQTFTDTPNCVLEDRQGQGDTRLTLTQSVIPNSNYVIMVSD